MNPSASLCTRLIHGGSLTITRRVKRPVRRKRLWAWLLRQFKRGK